MDTRYNHSPKPSVISHGLKLPEGTTIGVINGDTRSLDSGSYMAMYRVMQGSARDRGIGIRVSFSRLCVSFWGLIHVGPCNAVAAHVCQ